MNDYGVKYKTVMADNDLAKLRDSPVFDEVSNELKGASTEAQLIRIRTEAKVRGSLLLPSPAPTATATSR